MKKFNKKSDEQKKQELEELAKRFEEGIKAYIHSDRFKELLTNLSKFHTYSIRNSFLIAFQNPKATYVTTYPKWKSLNRQVKKGEKGIQIFVPIKRTVEMETEENVLDAEGQIVCDAEGNPLKKKEVKNYIKYKIGYVYDISQTSQIEGKEEKELEPCKELTGSIKNFDEFMGNIAKISPVPVSFEDIQSGAKGYYSDMEKKIVIQSGMSDTQTIKTSIHELAHSLLHEGETGTELSRSTKELQAESVAFIVCQHYEIDTSDYTFGYVGSWMEDEEQILQNLEIIKTCSSNIIEKLDTLMA